MSDLTARIREHIANGDTDAVNADALLAVLDKCAQMRAESAQHAGGVGHFFASEFEQTIAKALGIEP